MASSKYAQEYPKSLTKAVFEDVGFFDPPQNNTWEVVVIMCYKIFLVALFILT